MNWDEAVAEAAWAVEQVPEGVRDLEYVDGFADGAIYGARWQRKQMLTDEVVSRVGRRLNREGWTCYGGTHEPGQYDTCDDCKRVCDEHARAAIGALLGEGR